ncbi:porin [Massilia sp. CT11-108]|jgi:predicted porin|uniref:porin n=1 Tax=Massilia sp. CT11-108 TaxID=3393900 RepID=UPI0039A5F490
MKKNMISGIALAASMVCMSAAYAEPIMAAGPVHFAVSGVGDAQFEYVDAVDAAVPAQDKRGRFRVSNVSSELAFRASVDLGNGMTGLANFTTGIAADNGNANTTGGMFGSAKDVYVGIAFADVGTVKLGRMTAAARWNSGTADFSPMGAGLQDDQGMLSGASGQSAVGPQFNVRFDNTLAFESASFGGLSARVYYSANEGKSAVGTTNSPHLNDGSFSLGLQYVHGPLELRVSGEQRNDKGTLNGTNDHNTRDRDFRFGMRYTLPDGTILGLGHDRMRLSDANATGTAKSLLTKHGTVISARHAFGKHVVYGGYGVGSDVHCEYGNGAACNGNDTGARNAVIAYQYVFNKQMMFETFAAIVKNEARGRYDFDSGGVGPATGAQSRAIGAGLRYAF